MDAASDYLTVLQLAVGLNLVAGAYTNIRKEFENRVADEIDDYREIMAGIVRDQPDGPLDAGLEKKKPLTDRELYRYLLDVSNRFHERARAFSRFDAWIEFALIVIGIVSACGLVAATVWPALPITKSQGVVICLVSIVPAVLAFLKAFAEIRTHDGFYRRRQNDSRAEKEAWRNQERSRSDAQAGEIGRAINQVRFRAPTRGR